MVLKRPAARKAQARKEPQKNTSKSKTTSRAKVVCKVRKTVVKRQTPDADGMFVARKFASANALKPLPAFWMANGHLNRDAIPSPLILPYSLKLPKKPSLQLVVVNKSRQKFKADGKTAVFRGKHVFACWSCLRCFSGTVTAAEKNPGKRAINDFANQVSYSQRYAEAVASANAVLGKYVTAVTAEYMSGFPSGWTNVAPNSVDVKAFRRQFPHHADGSAKIPVVSLFSGVAGLELGLSKWMVPVLFVEQDSSCKEILKQRMQARYNVASKSGLKHCGVADGDARPKAVLTFGKRTGVVGQEGKHERGDGLHFPGMPQERFALPLGDCAP